MRNRRLSPRIGMLRKATLVSGGLPSRAECMLRDFSRTGARLTIDPRLGVPDEFVLVLGDGKRLSCRVAWRAREQIGVRFVVAAIGDLASVRPA